MKKRTSMVAKLLVAALAFAMILPASAKSYEFGDILPVIVNGVIQERSTAFDSARTPITVNGINYEMWTTLYQDTETEFRGATWVTTSNYENVPTRYMGTQCILYRAKSNGEMYFSSEMSYNTTPYYFWWSSTPTVVADNSGIYCGGFISLYDGTGNYVVKAPKTVEIFPSTRGFTASDDISAEINELEVALGENGEYPITASGKTYGSAMLADVVGYEPELILAEGTDGTTGYIRASDLHPNVNTPEEAMAYMAELADNTDGYRAIPLFDLDEKVIGSFHLYIPDLNAEIPAGIQTTIDQIEIRKNWSRNSKGEPYGSSLQLLEARAAGIELDLLSAVGTEGQSGYIRYSDTAHGQWKSRIETPEGALMYMEYLKTLPETYLIPLYDCEGNVIGEFRTGTGLGQTLSDEEISAQVGAGK